MLRWISLGFWIAAAALALGGEASACVYAVTLETFEPRRGQAVPDTPKQIAQREERAAKVQLRQATLAAKAELAAGIDPAAELSELLVPNIRPVHIEQGVCGGPPSEIDLAEGEMRRDEHWLAGTSYAGREQEFEMIWRGEASFAIGEACNTEIRRRFAAALRARLDAGQLEGSYVFLAPRGPSRFLAPRGPGTTIRSGVERMMAFEGRSRSPPVHLMVDGRHYREVAGWFRRDPAGRSLQGAMDDFWRVEAPKLADTNLACPSARADEAAEQARLVGLIDDYLAEQRGAHGR